MEEQILKTQEELNLIELYKIKKEIYNSSFKRFVDIFEKIENINFGIDIKYEDIDFSTILIDKNINDTILQENIFFTATFLDSANEKLKQKTDELALISTTNSDYFKFDSKDKESTKDAYYYARYIQILCTTNIYQTYLQNSIKLTSSISEEMKPKIWLFFKIYLKELFKNKTK